MIHEDDQLRVHSRRDFLRDVGGAMSMCAAFGVAAGCARSKSPTGDTSPSGSMGSSPATTSNPQSAEPTSPQSSSSGSPSSGVLPAYAVPSGLPRPDFQGSPGLLDNAYLAYPPNPPKTVAEPPGAGGELNSMILIYSAAPPGPDANALWQAVNKELHVSLKPTMVPAADYGKKLPVVIAGGDFPDTLQMPSFTLQPNLPQLLAAKFQDLSDFVAGDAVGKYPYLSYLPTAAWQSAAFDGHIYGVPLPKEPMPPVLFTRNDIIESAGLNAQPASFAEFRTLCHELTSPDHNRWAVDNPVGLLSFVAEMLHAPNNWSEKDGKFTAATETEAYRQAIAAVAGLYKDGVFHPDSQAASGAQMKDWMASGKVALHWDGFGAWNNDVFASTAGLSSKLGAMVPPGFDGGEGSSLISPSYFSLTLLKKTSKARVEEILRVLNWFAAPFGTAEYLLKFYGVKDVDYTLTGTDPILTAKGKNDTQLPLRYIASSEQVIYNPGKPDLTKAMYDYGKAIQPLILKDPTAGLFSNTNLTKGPVVAKALSDVELDIIVGRKSLSDWDSAVKSWRTNGGSQMAEEYAKAYASR